MLATALAAEAKRKPSKQSEDGRQYSEWVAFSPCSKQGQEINSIVGGDRAIDETNQLAESRAVTGVK